MIFKIPVSTYRLQLSMNFNFQQTISILDYLNNLGISDLYLSPITQANPGSLHGYDVIDPNHLNDELGTQQDFDSLCEHLKKLNMGLIIDIVPNHMAAVKDNKWYSDVLQKFKDSPYFNFFDINLNKSTPNQLVFRRFFDINELICVRVEDSDVFTNTHQLIFKLITQKLITGLRIDHIDGLIDPTDYLRKLNKFTHHKIYIIIEKILAREEEINPAWEIEGTTGYDFINELNQVFIYADGYQQLQKFYLKQTQQIHDITYLRYLNCKLVINFLFKNEFDYLVEQLITIKDQLNLEISDDDLRQCLLEFSANLPVYRTYITDKRISNQDQYFLSKTKTLTKLNAPNSDNEALEFLCQLLTLSLTNSDEMIDQSSLSFIKRWQVFTGPMVAKAYEDTTCYQYYPLLSLNEVGSDPNFFKPNSNDLNIFHQYQRYKSLSFPYSLNATSTHDTKRSEDIRARLSVLSELADEAIIFFKNSINYNSKKKIKFNNENIPGANDELMIYQILLAAWPLSSAENEVNDFKQRFTAFLVKSLREAKLYSNWQQPQTAYEQSAVQFCETILTKDKDNIFLAEFLIFQPKIAFYGMLNSLSQLILKITSPGVPDFYQGNEVWQFNLVDPDNRRNINFFELKKLAHEVQQIEINHPDDAIFHFLQNWKNGHIKFFLTKKLLQIKHQYRLLFNDGDYVSLQIQGKQKNSIIAFMRRHSEKNLLVILPRWFSQFVQCNQFRSDSHFWEDTYIRLPNDAPKQWQSVLQNKQFVNQLNNGNFVLYARTIFDPLFFGVFVDI